MNVAADTNVVVSAIFWPGELGSLSATLHRRLEQLSNSCPTFEAPRTNSP